MKSDVFNQYVDRVTELFKIEKAELFTKSKKQELVDARHLLYYLCVNRPMKLIYIEKYMAENGYNIKHNSIIHGVNSVESKLADDEDLASVIKSIQKAVYI
jgi:chromosomal replication initiation ATPase DnaA